MIEDPPDPNELDPDELEGFGFDADLTLDQLVQDYIEHVLEGDY